MVESLKWGAWGKGRDCGQCDGFWGWGLRIEDLGAAIMTDGVEFEGKGLGGLRGGIRTKGSRLKDDVTVWR